MELWIRNGRLIEEEQWARLIQRLKDETISFIQNETECVELVKTKLVQAVKKRMPSHRFGVFLSGGVDSSLLAMIAKTLNGDFVCYSVGFGAAKDVIYARKAAQQLGLQWKLKILTIEEIEQYITRAVEVMKTVQLVDSVSVGVCAVVMAAVDLAGSDGITTFVGGLGAEEIFGGYQRHVKSSNVDEECWRGLKAMWNRDLVRDAALANALGITVLTPFLDKELITAAMRIPGQFKIANGERKVILRKAAEGLGLSKEIAWRKKSAAMYGSNFDKALETLAKRHGLKMKKGEYLNNIRKAF